MKICPQCQTNYTDDSLRFCLQDGVPLNNLGGPSQMPASGPETVMRNPATWQQSGGSQYASAGGAQKKSRKGVMIALGALLALFFLGIASIGAFLAFRSLRDNFSKNSANQNSTKTANMAVNSNINISTNAGTGFNVNSTSNLNANSSANTNAANSTNTNAVAKPTLDPTEATQIREDVSDVIENWKNAAEDFDLDAHMSFYGPIVDYFKGGKMSIGRVRADKERGFSNFDTISVDIGDIEITPDASGKKALAVFDKEWKFESADKTNSGRVRSQLILEKFSDEWKIVSEKDLKVYHVGN